MVLGHFLVAVKVNLLSEYNLILVFFSSPLILVYFSINPVFIPQQSKHF